MVGRSKTPVVAAVVAAAAVTVAAVVVVAVDDEDGIQWQWWRGHSMAGAAFNGNGDGLRIGIGKAKMTMGGDGGSQHLPVAMEYGGCWRLTVAMDSSCVSSGNRDGI